MAQTRRGMNRGSVFTGVRDEFCPRNMPLHSRQGSRRKRQMDEALRRDVAALAGRLIGMVYMVAKLVRDIRLGVGQPHNLQAHSIADPHQGTDRRGIPPIRSA